MLYGSTNKTSYLKDETGGRRFWPIRGDLDKERRIDLNAVEAEIDQVYAEAVHIWRAMRKEKPFGPIVLNLSPAASAEATKKQEDAMVDTADEGQSGFIQEWLDTPVSLAALMSASDDEIGFEDLAANKDQMVIRGQFCLMEIWVDCLKRDPSDYDLQASNLLSKAVQRLDNWERVGRNTVKRFGFVRIYGRKGFNHFQQKRDGKKFLKFCVIPLDEFYKKDDDFSDLI